MSMNELAHLEHMANQIASNIGLGESEEVAVSSVVKHISLYWARPMREKICANIENSSLNLNPIATKALIQIRSQL